MKLHSPRCRALALGAILLCALSAACTRDDSGAFGSSVTPMDHDPSDTFVRTVYVNGRWVGSAGMGGKTVLGGISLPNKWHPGLTARVKWERCEPYGKNCRWTEKVVPIQRYDDVGHTDLHLLPGDRVLIIPTMLDPAHPNYPGPGYPTKNFFRNGQGKESPANE